MSSNTFLFRFAADWESRLNEEKPPEVGDVIKRNGEDWVVPSVAEVQDGSTVVTLSPEREPVRDRATPFAGERTAGPVVFGAQLSLRRLAECSNGTCLHVYEHAGRDIDGEPIHF